jgi:hypothetical protein
VHAELHAIAATLLKRSASLPGLTPESLPNWRKMMGAMVTPPPALPAVRKQAIKNRGGAPDVTVYVIDARPEQHTRL